MNQVRNLKVTMRKNRRYKKKKMKKWMKKNNKIQVLSTIINPINPKTKTKIEST